MEIELLPSNNPFLNFKENTDDSRVIPLLLLPFDKQKLQALAF